MEEELAEWVSEDNIPYRTHTDDEGQEDGLWVVKGKLKAEAKNRKTGKTWTQSVFVVDGKTNAIPSADPGAGSVVVCNFELNPWKAPSKKIGAGLQLRVKAVQVLTYVERSNHNSPEAYGFSDGGGDTFEGNSEDQSPSVPAERVNAGSGSNWGPGQTDAPAEVPEEDLPF